jgi:hypothetical protein
MRRWPLHGLSIKPLAFSGELAFIRSCRLLSQLARRPRLHPHPSSYRLTRSARSSKGSSADDQLRRLPQQSVCTRPTRAVGWSKSRDRLVHLVSDASELQVKRNCIDAFSTGECPLRTWETERHCTPNRLGGQYDVDFRESSRFTRRRRLVERRTAGTLRSGRDRAVSVSGSDSHDLERRIHAVPADREAEARRISG